MRLVSVLFSIYTSILPARLLAPAHATPRPTIPYLIAYSATRHGLPIDVALRRGWVESGWRNIVNQNGCCVGPMQVNGRYYPQVIKATVAERVDLGVEILADWYRACRGDEYCAGQAYWLGHLSGRLEQ